LVSFSTARSAEPGENYSQEKVREAVQRGLKIVTTAAANYPNHQTCFSCHHQTLPVLAAVAAGERKLAIDETLLPTQTEFTSASFHEDLEKLREGRGIGGRAMTVAYGLWALRLAEHKPDETTEAMVEYLLKTQHDDGHWSKQTSRPPLEESDVMCSVLTAYGLQHFAAESQRAKAKAAIDKARRWLAEAKLESQEDRAARLLGLGWLGGEEAEIAAAREQLLAAQRDDGGWGQLDDMPSDAYATGQALWVLQATGLETSSAAYQRGMSFLLRTQGEDGSWFVATRSKPVQPYFDNGDPHGKNQFISTPATCWAIAALAAGLEQQPADTAPQGN
jgi:N-acyl-D-amino-acid deacylase